ncbi:MAG TPA: HD domain-containing phosphohydrolase [Rhodocyclaceae bacterium]|nr:HD domain-containing phosphohydrolase [Rhodocyclaceae bacterium]HMW76760.1 HD domain-containing phosphohydrolase [Rhodocyclaceae bacterium]HNM82172.1 HD domain-containing phosphohydrolase [Rhodocyclaceae bacterium]HNP05498.1 HD domain-containing phosphohydrolase [Rhodocyclaceae bacterium]
MTSLHRLLLPRVLLVWLVLSLVAGGLTYWLEIRKIDQAVVNLAAAAIEHREGSHDPQFLASRANDFLGNGFVAVDILDAEGHNLGRAVSPGSESLASELDAAAGLARPDRPRYRTLHRNGATLVRVVIPLSLPSGSVSGYFEGVYAVGPAHLAALHADLWRTLLAVLAAVLVTAVVLYPVIVALNRSVYRGSLEILRGNLEMASVLGAAIAKRDSDTNAHNYRVTLYACKLGETVGVEGDALRALMLGAFLHDVGKIGIGDGILLKPSELSADEMATMRNHVALGVEIIASSTWLRPARDIIQFHHEWYDGNGYLKGLKGEEIPLNARIFAVVDVFDALTSRRPYKEPWTCDAALDWLDQQAGSHFDPALVAAFRPIARTLQPQLAGADENAVAKLLAGRIETYLLPNGGRRLKGFLRRWFRGLGAGSRAG